MMAPVVVNNDLLNVAKLFGNVDQVISDALRRYAIDQCVERVESGHAKIREYEKRYGATYPTFARKIRTDSKFLRHVEAKNPLWEEDAMEWNHRIEEVEEWTGTLERILSK